LFLVPHPHHPSHQDGGPAADPGRRRVRSDPARPTAAAEGARTGNSVTFGGTGPATRT